MEHKKLTDIIKELNSEENNSDTDIESAIKSRTFNIKNDNALRKAEENKRNSNLTKLFDLYVENYSSKIKLNKLFKFILFIACLIILLLSLGGTFWLLAYIVVKDRARISDIAIIISTLASFLGLIIGLLKIITTYVFPMKDEDHLESIVKLIQENDLQYQKMRNKEIESK